jgi:hypothetical protein
MAFFRNAIIDEIEEAVRIFRIDRTMAKTWNDHRRNNELRLLTGWTWSARDGSGRSKTGFQTYSAAARDAYYVVIKGHDQPFDVPTKKVISLDSARRKQARQKQHENSTPRIRAVG